jgi:hypothetical protein
VRFSPGRRLPQVLTGYTDFCFKSLMIQQRDKGFRSLFSGASFFLELLRFCIKEPWTAHIVPEDLEMIKTTVILPDFEKQEAAIIYKLKAVPDRPFLPSFCDETVKLALKK